MSAQVLGHLDQHFDLSVVDRDKKRRYTEEGYVLQLEYDHVPYYREFEVELFFRMSYGEIAIHEDKFLDYRIIQYQRLDKIPQLLVIRVDDVDPSRPTVF